ncbi:MAG: LysM peptidoglycan-binding domain-containing M23 family metallopeptidase, partial [Candidatus Promineifilaceae bacterium]
MTRLRFRHAFVGLLVFIAAFHVSFADAFAQEDTPEAPSPGSVVAGLGDTWTALGRQFGITEAQLFEANGVVNSQRQPAVGTEVRIPAGAPRNGRLARPLSGGLLELAARSGLDPWKLALQNDASHPFRPNLLQPVFLQGGSIPPHELPPGVSDLALSPGPIVPGDAFALRGRSDLPVYAGFDGGGLTTIRGDGRFTALGAMGAFFPPGEYMLIIQAGERPIWEQPLTVSDRDWTWEQITFTDSTVLDPAAVERERSRLQQLWGRVNSEPGWQGAFQMPILEYLEVSSTYGARRSVNGGPYNTYHEGSDFSAYQGTEVYAPAGAIVLLAEPQTIRGGSVILEHGLGLHSGYY